VSSIITENFLCRQDQKALQSARSIITHLAKDNNKINAPEVTNITKSTQCRESSVCYQVNRNLIPVIHSCISIVISGQRNKRQLVCEEDLLELNFDLDEMQELSTMSTHPHVRSLLLSLVKELQNQMKNIKCDLTENLNTVKKKWSDVVAGRSTCRKEEDPTSNRNLKSNITSHTTEELWIPVNRHKKTSICKSCIILPNTCNNKPV